MAANAARADEVALGIEGVVEDGHVAPHCRTGPFPELRSASIRPIFHRPAAFCAAGR
jgi:hypothetical protein